jgi:hypothetical protein
MQPFLDAMPMAKKKMTTTVSDTKPDRSTRHHLPDRVSANTIFLVTDAATEPAKFKTR